MWAAGVKGGDTINKECHCFVPQKFDWGQEVVSYMFVYVNKMRYRYVIFMYLNYTYKGARGEVLTNLYNELGSKEREKVI